ncbi:hypothetical protein [Shewanella youngdeokensis]|uniref:Porin n=1 Tax=Shewanella youngdeokensis TaxID=2999068 RepID=A0ABZ0JZR4_9GAMM|nr:hypothetical protein RGE70_03000 [Shewanella sp. DAU334]
MFKQLSSVAVLAVLLSTSAQAEVLKRDTSIGIGGRIHMGTDAKASNMANFFALSAKHKVAADWGQLALKAKYENPFGLKDHRYTGDALISFKTYADLYVHLGDSNFQLWWDEFSTGSTKIVEFTNLGGVAYHNSIGKLKYKIGAGAAYSMGHTPKASFNGPSYIGTRLDLIYPINKKLVAFAMYDSRWDRDEDFNDVYNWDKDHGHHAMLGGKYRFNDKFDLAVVYHHFNEMGGYNENGESIDLNFSYHL